MKRIQISALFVGVLACTWFFGSSAANSAATAKEVSGQGKMQFRVLYTSDHLPEEAQAVLEKAHGGFAIDRRDGQGEVYFALPGAGIIKISSDLSSTEMIETAPEMRDTNLHNSTIWYSEDGEPYLTFPGNQAAKVFTTNLDGELLHTLDAPTGEEDLGDSTPNDYFRNEGAFVPTDTEQLEGLMYIATGYSKLDYVLTAKIEGFSPLEAAWNNLAFGGKGTGEGQFGTGHGITVPPSRDRIDVADRPHSEVDRFSPKGKFLSTLKTEMGSFPCDIDYLDEYAVVPALHGPDREKGAPIYVFENDELISTVMIKEDLGLEKFQHIHNAVLHKNDEGKYYLIAQAWNPGDFAVLEQVTE